MVDIAGNHGNTALHLACQRGDERMTRTLLTSGAAVAPVAFDGTHPLHCAAMAGHLGCLRALIDAGASTAGVDEHGRSPLAVACSAGDAAATQVLLQAGAECATSGAAEHVSALHEAACAGSVECVEMLVSAGADVDAPEPQAYLTPTHVATLFQHAAVVHALAQHHANMESTDAMGRTPLHLACGARFPLVVRAGNRGTDPLMSTAPRSSGGEATTPSPSGGEGCWRQMTSSFACLGKYEQRGRDDTQEEFAILPVLPNVLRALLEEGASLRLQGRGGEERKEEAHGTSTAGPPGGWLGTPMHVLFSGGLAGLQPVHRRLAMVATLCRLVATHAKAGDMNLTDPTGKTVMDCALAHHANAPFLFEMVSWLLHAGGRYTLPPHAWPQEALGMLQWVAFRTVADDPQADKSTQHRSPVGQESLAMVSMGAAWGHPHKQLGCPILLKRLEQDCALTLLKCCSRAGRLHRADVHDMLASSPTSPFRKHPRLCVSPVHVAAAFGRVQMLRVLLHLHVGREAERPKPRTRRVPWEKVLRCREPWAARTLASTDGSGVSPLQLAMLNGNAAAEAMLRSAHCSAVAFDKLVTAEQRAQQRQAEFTRRLMLATGKLQAENIAIGDGDHGDTEPTAETDKQQPSATPPRWCRQVLLAAIARRETQSILFLRRSKAMCQLLRLAYTASDWRSPLLAAVKSGSALMIKWILSDTTIRLQEAQRGRQTVSWTALHEASHLGCLQTCSTLCNAGLAVGALSRRRRTPLHIAAREGHKQIVEALLERGASVDARDDLGLSPLHMTAARGHVSCARSLIRAGANVTAVANTSEGAAWTPIHAAASSGFASVIAVLVASGADVNASSAGTTPLLLACQNGHVGAVRQLVSDSTTQLNTCGLERMTPLLHSIRRGHAHIALLLTRCEGVDVHARDSSGRTALHYSVARADMLDVTKALVDRGCLPHERDSSNSTALNICAGNETSTPALKFLLSMLRPGAFDEDFAQNSPVHTACSNGCSDALAILVSAGAPLETVHNSGLFALHLATLAGHAECVNLLLESGVNPNVEELRAKLTPLHMAAGAGTSQYHQDTRCRIVGLLLAHGAAIDAQDTWGQTACHFSAFHDHYKPFALLVKAGARLSIEDSASKTPLQIAISRRSMRTLAFAVAAGKAKKLAIPRGLRLQAARMIVERCFKSDRATSREQLVRQSSHIALSTSLSTTTRVPQRRSRQVSQNGRIPTMAQPLCSDTRHGFVWTVRSGELHGVGVHTSSTRSAVRFCFPQQPDFLCCGHDCVVVGTSDCVSAYGAESFDARWTTTLPPGNRSRRQAVVVANASVIVTHDDRLVCMSLGSGSLLWESPSMDTSLRRDICLLTVSSQTASGFPGQVLAATEDGSVRLCPLARCGACPSSPLPQVWLSEERPHRVAVTAAVFCSPTCVVDFATACREGYVVGWQNGTCCIRQLFRVRAFSVGWAASIAAHETSRSTGATLVVASRCAPFLCLLCVDQHLRINKRTTTRPSGVRQESGVSKVCCARGRQGWHCITSYTDCTLVIYHFTEVRVMRWCARKYRK